MVMGTMLETHVLSTTQDNGVVNGFMRLARSAAVEAECVVEERAVAFLNGVKLLDEVGMQLVKKTDVLGNIGVVLLFVR